MLPVIGCAGVIARTGLQLAERFALHLKRSAFDQSVGCEDNGLRLQSNRPKSQVRRGHVYSVGPGGVVEGQ